MYRVDTDKLNNFSASISPTVSDDDSAGYEVGSFWIDTTTGDTFVCSDPSTGAAAWRQLNNIGVVYVVNEITGASHTVATTEDAILCNRGTTGTVAITLPAGATHRSGRVVVKDKKGDASTNNVTITPDGAETIDGQANLVIAVNYGAAALQFNGTDWSII